MLKGLCIIGEIILHLYQNLIRCGESATPLSYSVLFVMSNPEKEYIVRLATEVIQSLGREDMFLVDVVFKKGRKTLVNVLADTDTGIQLKECVHISRKMSARLEEDNFFEFPYTLEVSSPGTERGLDSPRLYRKNQGRDLRVFLKDGKEQSGKLLEVTDTAVVLETAKVGGKKGEKELSEIPFEQIRESLVNISFKVQ
jgi:ribosome maturation factor RimP